MTFYYLLGQAKPKPVQPILSKRTNSWADFKLESGSHEKDLQRPHVEKRKQFVLPSTSSKVKPDPHICLRCGSEISRGRDFYKKRHWKQKRNDQPEQDYAKHIVPKNHEQAHKLLRAKKNDELKEDSKSREVSAEPDSVVSSDIPEITFIWMIKLLGM